MTTPKDAATPRPWHTHDNGAAWEVRDRNGDLVTELPYCDETSARAAEVDAELMCRAVNAHDALVKALQKILVARDDEEVVTIASDALALAGVES